MSELFVIVNKIGFSFYLNEKFRRNLISPSFFCFLKEQTMLLAQSDSIFAKATKDAFPTPKDIFLIGDSSENLKLTKKQIVRCSDNKFRRCQGVKFSFVYDGLTYNEEFFVDPLLVYRFKIHVLLSNMF